jgi:hypothetical protein
MANVTLPSLKSKTLLFVSSTKTQSDARTDCKRRGGDLITLSSDVERTFVLDALLEMSRAGMDPGNPFGAWVGLESINRAATTDKASCSPCCHPAADTGVHSWLLLLSAPA